MDGEKGGLRNPFARDKSQDGDEEEIVANCHIGTGSSFRGTLMIEGTLLVDGDFQGDILNCDRIIVGPYGHVRADVHVREAMVAGVSTAGSSEERIDLLRGARVKGDRSPRSSSTRASASRGAAPCSTRTRPPKSARQPVGTPRSV
jgi:hypothetical protein